MLVFLSLLFALNGGAFGAPFHGTVGLTNGTASTATRSTNDGMTGPIDLLPPAPPDPKTLPSTTAAGKGLGPVQYDGMTGPIDHP